MKIKKIPFLFVFVFITGAIIMMIEMVAFRLMTVYFGASLFVWANIIGQVMIALAIGYYFGGKFADRYPQKKLLMLIVLLSGVIISFLPIIYNLILPYFTGGFEIIPFFDSLVVSSFIVVALLFLVPLAFLGFVSPFVTRLENKELETTGTAAGSVYAFSTVGSIFGTFFASFYTIPFLGIKETVLISGFSLILISLIGLRKDFKKALLLLLLIPFLVYFIPAPARPNLLYEKESFYGLIQVLNDPQFGYVLDINRSGRWSVYHPDKVLTGMYFDYFTPLYYLLDKKEDLDVLIIGHAGGVISRQYSYFFQDENIKIDGIELDPEVTKTAYKFFNLGEQKGLNVINTDGRIYLQNNSKKYDLIFVDAFVGPLYIPYQLSTKEFLDLTKSRLKEGGVFAMMVLANSSKDKVFQCLGRGINSVYLYSYFYSSSTRAEYFIVASNSLLDDKFQDLEKITDIQYLKPVSKDIAINFQKFKKLGKECILTDNRAPVELLGEIDRFLYAIKTIKLQYQGLTP